jgi:hypothetical protein
MPINLFEQAEDVRKQAYEIFHKNEKSVEEDVTAIKEWLKIQHHLPEKTNDATIRNFLIMNKFSIEKTKQKIDMYYTMRSVIPDLYCNPKSPQIKDYMNDMYVGIIPVPVRGLFKTFCFKSKELNKLSLKKLAMVVSSISEVRLNDDCYYREIMILDMENVTLNDILKITPSLIAKIFAVYEKVYALRLEGLYLVNAPPFVSKLLAIFKAVLKPKIFDRIQVHQDTECLRQLLGNDALPADYGGNGPSLQDLNDLIMLKFEDYQERFDQLDKMRVDENLRPEQLNNDEILGFYGNFRKLNVD